VIYHAGTGRTTFIACLKLTTIFVFVFFGLVVTPAYLKSDHPVWHAGGGTSYDPKSYFTYLVHYD
jgi:hypothetical protein